MFGRKMVKHATQFQRFLETVPDVNKRWFRVKQEIFFRSSMEFVLLKKKHAWKGRHIQMMI